MIRSPALTVSLENVATIAELFHGLGILGCDVIYDHIAKEIINVTASPAPMPAARINTFPQKILVMIIAFIIFAVSVFYSVFASNLFKHNAKLSYRF
jgi:L-asparagine transporter-like permease